MNKPGKIFLGITSIFGILAMISFATSAISYIIYQDYPPYCSTYGEQRYINQTETRVIKIEYLACDNEVKRKITHFHQDTEFGISFENTKPYFMNDVEYKIQPIGVKWISNDEVLIKYGIGEDFISTSVNNNGLTVYHARTNP